MRFKYERGGDLKRLQQLKKSGRDQTRRVANKKSYMVSPRREYQSRRKSCIREI